MSADADQLARAAYARTFRHAPHRKRATYYPPRSLTVVEQDMWHARFEAITRARGRPEAPIAKGIAEFRALLDLRHDPHAFDHVFKEPSK